MLNLASMKKGYQVSTLFKDESSTVTANSSYLPREPSTGSDKKEYQDGLHAEEFLWRDD